MFDTDFIVRYLHLATENAESLQQSLSHRQNDVLALEEAVQWLSAGHATGQLVVDRAEDLRRAVSIHAEDELPIVRSGLNYANSATAEALGDGPLAPEAGRTLTRMVEVTDREARRAVEGLVGIVNSLSSTAHAISNDPRLVSLAQRSVEESASLLEQTRRAVFRIVEDLPDITNAVRETCGAAQDSPMGGDFGTVAEVVENPGWLQVQEVPHMNRNPARGPGGPGR